MSSSNYPNSDHIISFALSFTLSKFSSSMCCVSLCASCIHNRLNRHHLPYAKRCVLRLYWFRSLDCSTSCYRIDPMPVPSWIVSISYSPLCWSVCRASSCLFCSALPITMSSLPYVRCSISGHPVWWHHRRPGVILDNWPQPRPVASWVSKPNRSRIQTIDMLQLRF